MKIFVGADHRGYPLKEKIKKFLKTRSHTVIDVGTHKPISCDYPIFAYKVAKEVAKNKNSRGILICMTGIGNSIAANKVRGARAALCYNRNAARLSRLHNDANILVLGSKYVKQKKASQIAAVWLKTKFEGGRHARRLNQIKQLEKKR